MAGTDTFPRAAFLWAAIILKNFRKNFQLCGRRRRRGGPLAAVPSPAARRAPAAATAAQIENVCDNFFRNLSANLVKYGD